MHKKCDHTNVCSQCGLNLIHQNNRGLHESSSEFGQWVHDTLPKNFYFMDVDGVTWARRTNVLRFFEHKPLGGGVRGSQADMLPRLAKIVKVGVDIKLFASGSGVFVIQGLPPGPVLVCEYLETGPQQLLIVTTGELCDLVGCLPNWRLKSHDPARVC